MVLLKSQFLSRKIKMIINYVSKCTIIFQTDSFSSKIKLSKGVQRQYRHISSKVKFRQGPQGANGPSKKSGKRPSCVRGHRLAL